VTFRTFFSSTATSRLLQALASNTQLPLILDSTATSLRVMASTDNPQNGAGRPLPKKELDTFRNLVKCYETKLYKKAIKLADIILKKFPKHGETLAMKGLTYNYMGKKEEAHALIKEGLMNDMR
jgi:tetratricopeptide (TPR) repeat protein